MFGLDSSEQLIETNDLFQEYLVNFEINLEEWHNICPEMKLILVSIDQTIKYYWTNYSMIPQISPMKTRKIEYNVKFIILYVEILKDIKIAAKRHSRPSGIPCISIRHIKKLLGDGSHQKTIEYYVRTYRKSNEDSLKQIKMHYFRRIYAETLKNIIIASQIAIYPTSRVKFFSVTPTDLAKSTKNLLNSLDLFLSSNPFLFYSAPFYYIYYPELRRDLSYRCSAQIIENLYSPVNGHSVPDRFHLYEYYSSFQKNPKFIPNKNWRVEIPSIFNENLNQAAKRRVSDLEHIIKKKRDGIKGIYVPKSKKKSFGLERFDQKRSVHVGINEWECCQCGNKQYAIIDGQKRCVDCGLVDEEDGFIAEQMISRNEMSFRANNSIRTETIKQWLQKNRPKSEKFNVGYTLLKKGLLDDEISRDVFGRFKALTLRYVQSLMWRDDEIKEKFIKLCLDYEVVFFLLGLSKSINEHTFIKLSILLASEQFNIFPVACTIFNTDDAKRTTFEKLIVFMAILNDPPFSEFKRIKVNIRPGFFDEFQIRFFCGDTEESSNLWRIARHFKNNNALTGNSDPLEKLITTYQSVSEISDIYLLNENFYAFLADIGKYKSEKEKAEYLLPKIMDWGSMNVLIKKFKNKYPQESKKTLARFNNYFSLEQQSEKLKIGVDQFIQNIAKKCEDTDRCWYILTQIWDSYQEIKKLKYVLKKWNKKQKRNIILKHEVSVIDIIEVLAIFHRMAQIFPKLFGKTITVPRLCDILYETTHVRVYKKQVDDLVRRNRFNEMWDVLTLHLVIETKLDVISLKQDINNTPFDRSKERLQIFWDAVRLSPKKRLWLFEKYILEKMKLLYSNWSPHSEFWYFGNRQLENRSCIRHKKNMYKCFG